MNTHEGPHAQRAQDIIDDVFDLALIVLAILWSMLEVHLTDATIAQIAIAGASARTIFRRVFRTILGPRINRWVERERAHASAPNSAPED